MNEDNGDMMMKDHDGHHDDVDMGDDNDHEDDDKDDENYRRSILYITNAA